MLGKNELKSDQTAAIERFMRIVTTKRLFSHKCPVSTEGIEAKGAIVNFTTGGGKTLVALGAARALIDQGAITHIVILVPTQTLVRQWISQFYDASLKYADDIHVAEIPSEIKGIKLKIQECREKHADDEKYFCINDDVKVSIRLYSDYRVAPLSKNNKTFYILDEIQNVYSVISSGANSDLLSTISSDATFCLGLSATPVVDNVLDLVYALHSMATPSDALSSLFPLSINQFKRKYSSVSRWKSAVFGYIGPLMNIKIGGGVILMTFILGTLDYYNLQDLKIRAKRQAFLDKIFSHFGPLVAHDIGKNAQDSKKAFTEFNLSWNAVRRLYSTLIYFTLLDPFHVLIPTIVASFMLANTSEKIFTYDYKRLATAVAPWLIKRDESPIRAMGTFETLVTSAIQLVAHADVRYEHIAATADVPAIFVASRKVNYNQPNAKTLYHFSTRMLTITELRKILGRDEVTQQEYEMSPLVQGVNTDEKNIVYIGRMIGNLIYTDNDIVAINREYANRVKMQAKAIGIDNIMSDFAKKQHASPLPPLSPLPPRDPSIVVRKYKPNSKFDAIINRITHMHTNDQELKKQETFRVCIFSEFWHAVTNLRNYMKSNPIFMSFVASLDIMPRIKESEGETSDNNMVQKYNSESEQMNTKKRIRILFLGPEYAEGFSGVYNTFVMFILEPVASYSRLLQVRGRVARKNTHTRDVKKVLIVEVCASLTLYRKTFLRFLQKDRARIHRDTEYFVIPGLENLLTSQTITPDEIVLQQQQASRKLDVAINNAIKECGDFVGESQKDQNHLI
jgi:hypothetical protein